MRNQIFGVSFLEFKPKSFVAFLRNLKVDVCNDPKLYKVTLSEDYDEEDNANQTILEIYSVLLDFEIRVVINNDYEKDSYILITFTEPFKFYYLEDRVTTKWLKRIEKYLKSIYNKYKYLKEGD